MSYLINSSSQSSKNLSVKNLGSKNLSVLMTMAIVSLSSANAFANSPTTKLPLVSPTTNLPTTPVTMQPAPQSVIPSTPASQQGSGDIPLDDYGDDSMDEGDEMVTMPPVAQQNLPTPATTNPTPVINPDVLRAADNVPPTIEQVPLGTLSPATIQKFVKLIDTVRQEYVRPVNDELLFENAMTGVLAGLDPYSEYLNPEAYNNLRLFTEGDIGSIGIDTKFDTTSQQWVVSKVIANSPAAKAGIQLNDYIYQINDNKLQDTQTQQDIDQLLSGIAGTQVKLVVSNQGRRKHSVILQRSLVQQQAINAKIINGIAVVHIPIFQSNTQQQMLDALTKINQPFSAIIIDLRNNPGGILSAATDIASLFMQDKTVVQIHGRHGVQEIIKTRGTPHLATIPLVLLQNRYSASASEVLASSLQENGRAKIMGETSYGKGSIQSVVPLMANDAVKLTVAHYYSGLGKKIDGVGVRADTPLQGGELSWEGQALQYLLSQPRTTHYVLQNPATKP